jgi:murein L,D-transpeptidase YafK
MVWRTTAALAALLLAATHGQVGWFSGMRDERGAGQSGMAMAAVHDRGNAAQAVAEPLPDSVDGLLERIFSRIEAQQLDAALELTDQLVQRYPKYRLGYLIKGDLLSAQMQSIDGFGASVASAERIAELQAEAMVRLKAYRERPPAGHVPRNLLKMTSEQSHAVVVDASRSRLYLFRNDKGQPHLVADYYITLGELGIDKFREGDKRTPLGVYRVNSTIPRNQLIDLYGSAAFTLNYPNSWDRQRGRSGSGIWLHGTLSDTFARPPLASKGCVVLTNPDIDAMASHLQDGITPVIISDRIEWISRADWQRERDQLASLLDAWRADGGQGGSQPDADKLSIFRNPGQDEIMVLNFEQPARNGAVVSQKKVQYWMREAGRWKMVHEGLA